MANSKGKCTGCKSRFPTEQLEQLPAGKFCAISCAIEYGIAKADKARAKAKKAKDKEHNKRKRSLKDNDRSFQLKKTQQLFNKYIRLRDNDSPCISCGKHHMGQYHAGHYRSVGSAPELRFDSANCWKQCAPCNNHLSGNLVNYRINLIARHGVEIVDYLEGPHKPKRYTIAELKELQVKYSQKIKELENAEN